MPSTYQLGERLRIMRQERGCSRCGSKRKRLEFAHVKPTPCVGRGRGLRNRYYDICRNPDHYEVMCRGCHALFDLHRILNPESA